MPSKSRSRGVPPPETETHSDHIENLVDWSQATAGDTLPASNDWAPNSNNNMNVSNNHNGNNNDNNNITPANIRSNVSLLQTATVRAVTPEPGENGRATDTSFTQVARGFGAASPQQSSPRSIPGGEARRQGIVFNDACNDSLDNNNTSTSPPPQHQKAPLRPRTHTVDGALALRQQNTSPVVDSNRHRVGSFSSSGSQPFADVDIRPPPTVLESVGYPSVASPRPPDLKISSSSSKEKKSSNRRLIKRANPRPTSPLVSPPPSVDSLPLPVPTDDANKILLLMKTLCGRMKGEIEYQGEPNGPWHTGTCYIDEDRGSLVFDSAQNGPYHTPLVADLRGCRVLPVDGLDGRGKCLEIHNHKIGVDLLLRPIPAEEFDLWLASLLCWQQLRPSAVRFANGRSANPPGSNRTEMRRRGSSAAAGSSSKDAAIIKVGKVKLWDKGVATSPRAIVKRPSTRYLRSGQTSWREVSCILQDNGEFKLMSESDVTVLSVIELSQLSRCAVQQLDRSVLDREFCIAIFPIYTSTSKQLSIFRPVFLSLNSRVLFEVWFVLLRAFAVPDLFGIEASGGQVTEVRDFEREFEGQLFRLEKTIQVRVTEAKICKPTPLPEHHHDRHAKDRDALAGNYLAEVILDGEVRSRTTTQPNTKNPFWRESSQFTELPTTLPYLSIILKRVESNPESFSHQLQASLGLPRTGNFAEALCGSVDISLDKLERAKDHEQWFQVYDENQESIGNMLVKINHDELIVLAAKDYERLSELLHKFSVGLTSQIAVAIPTSMRRLAELFLNIFQVSGSSGQWLMALVEEEIDGISSQNSMKRVRFSRRLKSNDSGTSSNERDQLFRDVKSLAGEANLLFRGNTLLTQALEFHMRRLGKEYLEDILKDKINEINDLNPDCEVDPSRVQHGDNIQQHWDQLIALTSDVWECIADSATKLPLELRQILKYVRAVAEDRYGDFLRTVNYTSVSGFLFLRFICPAILNPKLFGLLRDNPRHRAQRTLTLIAKGLQALANLSTFGKKESWMEQMNKFLSSHRQPFRDYIDQMCSIPTDTKASALPASYSTPITIMGRLSPASREGFPSLPYLIDHPRNFAALVKLWLESNHKATYMDPADFDAELAEFHALCLEVQRRSDECLARVEALRAENESGVEDLAENFEKSSFIDSVNTAYSNMTSWTDNDPYRPPGSSGSDMDGGDRPAYRNFGREGNRHGSDNPFEVIRAKAGNVKSPRSFLHGLIGGKKAREAKEGRESGGSGSTVRDKSRDKEEKEKGSRGILGTFSESRQGESNSRH
ncbi:Rho GTPase activation protein [Durotheca rogersii]|uniref:Rho GTPase activation protein n=1 Tax=Durotheca rogersii TaxID=419775 RepID=UPI002220D80C|nr:Rho GTPase activation protein [Durotheca rogersii]KAI5867107.1 Rho GTPase activation protein [Durotheca rogersii]